MKRLDLIRNPEHHGCSFLREGARHSVYVNRSKGKSSTVPRHREINDFLARKICKDLEVPEAEDAQPRVRADRPPALQVAALGALRLGVRSSRTFGVLISKVT